MAFDGNGNWISNFSAVADRDADIKILASRFDGIFIDDIANSFDNCLTRDGQGKTLTNFNANNYRVINVANPSADKDAVNKQTLESSKNTLLTTLYPVGSIYIGTQSTCPLATLIAGSTWQKIEGRYLLASGTLSGTSETYSATNTVGSGLPNITGKTGAYGHHGGAFDGNGAFYEIEKGWGIGDSDPNSPIIGFNANLSNNIYGSSSAVRAPAYVVNVWRRTA